MKNTKRFTKNDTGFICANCQKEVLPLGYSSRDHCPGCLFSMHVDIMPGDRKNTCGGILEPVQTEPNADADLNFDIIFKCRKCGGKIKNRSASDDNKKLLIRLTNPEN